MRKLLFLLAFIPFILFSQTTSEEVVIGDNVREDGSDFLYQNNTYIYYQKFTIEYDSVHVDSIYHYTVSNLTGASTQYAIYSDNAGVPGTLLFTSVANDPPWGPGWHFWTFSSTVNLTTGDYWFARGSTGASTYLAARLAGGSDNWVYEVRSAFTVGSFAETASASAEDLGSYENSDVYIVVTAFTTTAPSTTTTTKRRGYNRHSGYNNYLSRTTSVTTSTPVSIPEEPDATPSLANNRFPYVFPFILR